MKKVLFVNPFGIGDVIFSLYAASALKKARPDVRIDFMGNERTIDLLRMDRDLSRCYVFNRDKMRQTHARSLFGFAGTYRRIIADWKKEKYDALFDFSLGREFGLLGWMAGIKSRYGFDYKGRGLFLSHRVKLEGYEGHPVAETQIELLQRADLSVASVVPPIDWKSDPDLEQKAAELLKDTRVRQWMALAPGGGKSWGENAIYKQWDPEKFAETANQWAESSGGVVLLGDTSEARLLERARAELHVPSVVICGESLGLVAAVLKQARVFLGNDGGLLHLAHALGTRAVGVYGPVDEWAYGPSGSGALFETVAANVPCRPCYKKFNFPPCPNARVCLTDISVQNVLESLDKIA